MIDDIYNKEARKRRKTSAASMTSSKDASGSEGRSKGGRSSYTGSTDSSALSDLTNSLERSGGSTGSVGEGSNLTEDNKDVVAPFIAPCLLHFVEYVPAAIGGMGMVNSGKQVASGESVRCTSCSRSVRPF